MSKMSKTIAILGVVAGLGVAALPLSSYAADATVTTPDKVEDTDGDGSVEQAVGINLTIEKTLSIDASADNVNLNATNNYTGEALKVNVITNNAKGYKLNIAGTATGDKTGLTGDDANTTVIPTFEKTLGTDGTGTLASLAANSGEGASKSVWGYTASGDDVVSAFDGGLYAGVTEAGSTIATLGTPTADTGSETSVTFKAIVDAAQPAGTYKGQVTFTASDIND